MGPHATRQAQAKKVNSQEKIRSFDGGSRVSLPTSVLTAPWSGHQVCSPEAYFHTPDSKSLFPQPPHASNIPLESEPFTFQNHLQVHVKVAKVLVDAINGFHVFWGQVKVKHLQEVKTILNFFPIRQEQLLNGTQ